MRNLLNKGQEDGKKHVWNSKFWISRSFVKSDSEIWHLKTIKFTGLGQSEDYPTLDLRVVLVSQWVSSSSTLGGEMKLNIKLKTKKNIRFRLWNYPKPIWEYVEGNGNLSKYFSKIVTKRINLLGNYKMNLSKKTLWGK